MHPRLALLWIAPVLVTPACGGEPEVETVNGCAVVPFELVPGDDTGLLHAEIALVCDTDVVGPITIDWVVETGEQGTWEERSSYSTSGTGYARADEPIASVFINPPAPGTVVRICVTRWEVDGPGRWSDEVSVCSNTIEQEPAT